MTSERNDSDKDNEERKESDSAAPAEDNSRDESARDDDESDEDEESDEESEGEARAASAAEGEEVEEEGRSAGPRNRTERRSLAKKAKRGQIDATGEEKVKDRNKRERIKPVVPKMTVTGKSTASNEDVPMWAKRGAEWLTNNRNAVLGAAAIAVLGVGAFLWTGNASAAKRAHSAAELVTAAQSINGEVRAADAPADPPNAPPRLRPTFNDYNARARAALSAADRVATPAPDGPAAPLGQLLRAFSLYELGRYAEAKTAFESVVGKDLAGMEGRALEGLGFTLEAMNDLPGALRKFEELGRIEGDGWRDLGALHQARVLRRQDQNNRAKDIVRGLIERLNRARPDDTAASSSASVLEQAQGLLREIDPEDPLARRAAAMPAGMDQEALMRMLQQQMGNRGRVRPGGGGSGGGAR